MEGGATIGQFYNRSTIIIYNFRVVPESLLLQWYEFAYKIV